jgi:branched-chain amino acid transport system substrate-binding protein
MTIRAGKFLAMAAVTALVAAGCAEGEPDAPVDGAAPEEETDEPIKIGAVLDITGAGASLGVPERNTLEILAEALNEAGGINGREVELIIEDNQSTEDAAARAATDLIQSEEVDILLGASRTGPSLAMRPIAEQAEIPMISLAANAAIVDGSEWVFKTAQNDVVVIERIIADAAEKGYQTLALARDASGFGEGVPELFDEVGSEAGVEIIAVEEFAPDATDFTAQMVNLRDTDADAVVIWGIPPAAAVAQQSYQQLQVGKPVYQSHGIGNQVFLETAGESAEGLIAPLGRLLVVDQLPDDDPQKQVITDYIAQYSEAFPDQPASTFGGHAYDAFMIAVQVIEEVGTDPNAIRDALETFSGYDGITGSFEMSAEDHSGLTNEALVLVTIEDGEWTLVEGD